MISRKGVPNSQGLGRLRYVVEQTFSLLHHFKRLAVRWEGRLALHDALISLACGLICWRRLKRPVQGPCSYASTRSRSPDQGLCPITSVPMIDGDVASHASASWFTHAALYG